MDKVSVVALSSSGGLVLQALTLDELEQKAIRLLPKGVKIPNDLPGVLARALATSRRGVIIVDRNDSELWELWELSQLNEREILEEDVLIRRDELIRILADHGVLHAHIGAVAGLTRSRVGQIVAASN